MQLIVLNEVSSASHWTLSFTHEWFDENANELHRAQVLIAIQHVDIIKSW